jgi:magnesium transporter
MGTDSTRRTENGSSEGVTITARLRPAVVVVRPEATVADALARLRAADPAEPILYAYAIEADGRLSGVVPVRRLAVAAPGERLEALIVREPVTVTEDAPLAEALALFQKHRFLALPAVDRAGRLVGVLGLDAVSQEFEDLVRRQAFDDAFQLVGVHVALGRQAGAWASFRDRFPWLLFNIGGGLACALLAGLFTPLFERLVVLALFVPVVLAVSESVGMQSLGLTLETLHATAGARPGFARALARELAVALLLGAGTGALVGAIAALWHGLPALFPVLGIAIAAAVVTASLLGVALPFTLRALSQDPRIAAGPVVLAAADLVALTLYLVLAARLLA